MEKKSQDPDFWENQEQATEISKEVADLKEDVEEIEEIKKELKGLEELSKITSSEEKLEQEIEKKVDLLEKRISKEEIKAFLSEKYDKGNAILSIFSGAGGQDAEDWTTMLLRMYARFCEDKGFKIKVLDQSFGDGGGPEGRIGTKEVTVEIKGRYAYGFLKHESGAHRMVRLSPFSSQNLRHTSFSRVEVLPEISKPEELEIKIDPEDLKLETFRSSGPGGQHVNKRETAVRVIHIPTGIRASCQSERSQGLNRERAEALLYSKIYQKRLLEQEEKLKKMKGSNPSVSWGKQIRSYIFHPYKLVKDNRTNIKINNIEEVLNGNLDEFIEAEIRLK